MTRLIHDFICRNSRLASVTSNYKNWLRHLNEKFRNWRTEEKSHGKICVTPRWLFETHSSPWDSFYYWIIVSSLYCQLSLTCSTLDSLNRVRVFYAVTVKHHLQLQAFLRKCSFHNQFSYLKPCLLVDDYFYIELRPFYLETFQLLIIFDELILPCLYGFILSDCKGKLAKGKL